MTMIYKYSLEIIDLQAVAMPRGAKLLSVANQRGELCLWASVDTAKPDEARHIRIVGTGHEYDPTAIRAFIGTVVIDPFVWHVFEEIV